jgi:hypothetical protein
MNNPAANIGRFVSLLLDNMFSAVCSLSAFVPADGTLHVNCRNMKTLNSPTVFSVKIGISGKAFMLLTIIMISFLLNAKSQSTNDLIQLNDYPFEVFYSAGHEKKAKEIATKCDSAIKYMYQNVLEFKPVMKVYVLNPEDWKQYPTYPIYGIPHSQDSNLIVSVRTNSRPF